MTFCPEDGDPAMVKPRLYIDAAVFEARNTQGVLVSGDSLASKGIDDESIDLIERLLGSQRGNPLG